MFWQLVENGFAVGGLIPKDGFFLVIISSALGAGHEPAKELILGFSMDRRGREARTLPMRHPAKLAGEVC